MDILWLNPNSLGQEYLPTLEAIYEGLGVLQQIHEDGHARDRTGSEPDPTGNPDSGTRPIACPNGSVA